MAAKKQNSDAEKIEPGMVVEGSGTILTTCHEHWHNVPHDGT